MDPLNPELMWIGSRCYRVNVTNNERIEQSKNFNFEDREEDDYEFEECKNGKNDDLTEIEEINHRNHIEFRTKFHVNPTFYSHLIGRQATTKKRLESDTRTQIDVPRVGSKDTNVIISGRVRNDVLEAKSRILALISGVKSKLDITHFVTIRFSHDDEIRENFIRFREETLKDPAIHPDLFTPPAKLHMTITVSTLIDDFDRKLASDLLHECKQKIVDPIKDGKDIEVKVHGIDIMNDDPSAVNVLYGIVDCNSDDRLQKICNEISQLYHDRELSSDKRIVVKMHMTLMNSRYLKKDEMESNQNFRKNRANRPSFNATEIMKKFQDFYFGKIVVNQIHLVQCKTEAADGFYQSTTLIDI